MAEGQPLKKVGTTLGDASDIAGAEGVGQTHPHEAELPQGIAGEGREADRVLIVIHQPALQGVADVQSASGYDRVLLSLVKLEAVEEDREAALNGFVKQIGLGEPDHEDTLPVAPLGVHAQGLAQAEEIVGGVVQTEEAAQHAAGPAGEPDAVLALLSDLQS